jgi:8-oxo-dGTP diphosphatase
VTFAEGASATFPMKYVSAGALFFNGQGRLLIVKPTYKDGWEIPGGIVERDESPLRGCLREIREEIGLEVRLGQLLAVDYKSRQADRPVSLQFMFFGGVLTSAQIESIQLPESELSAYQFADPDRALDLLAGTLPGWVAASLRAIAEGRTLMLHDGEEALLMVVDSVQAAE